MPRQREHSRRITEAPLPSADRADHIDLSCDLARGRRAGSTSYGQNCAPATKPLSSTKNGKAHTCARDRLGPILDEPCPIVASVYIGCADSESSIRLMPACSMYLNFSPSGICLKVASDTSTDLRLTLTTFCDLLRRTGAGSSRAPIAMWGVRLR